MNKSIMDFALIALVLTGMGGCSSPAKTDAKTDVNIPNLMGVWTGENKTYSDKKGYLTWTKTIEITEQKGRLFKGHFSYLAGSKSFSGVIYPDNTSFTWVGVDSKGYNHGRIYGADRISACYVESGEDATVGCVELMKQKSK